MLHGDHVVAVLRNKLLVRDGAVVYRNSWDQVRVWYVRCCGEGHALSGVMEGKRWNRWEDDLRQRGKRVFSSQLLNLPLQLHPAILKPSPYLHQIKKESL